jgi:hypothetical protein
MDMNYPSPDRESCRGDKVQRTYEIVMAVQHVVMTPVQFGTQGADKTRLASNRHWRMKDSCAERPSLVVQQSRTPERTVKGPVEADATLSCMAQHPHQPILNGASVKALDYMKGTGLGGLNQD